MKKIILSVVAMASLAFSAQAQTTLDFETWVHTNGPPAYDDPQGWATFNLLSNPFLGGNPVSVFKETTNPHGGAASMRLESIALVSNPAAGQIPDTIGITLTGSISLNGILPGYAFSSRPQYFNWYGKFSPANGVDSGFAFVFLTKWNGTSSDTIAVAGRVLGSAVPAWQGYNDPFIYNTAFNNLIPDTMVIAFSATDDVVPRPGGTLWVDDISFTGYVGIEDAPTAANEVRVFPNPATEFTNLSFTSLAAKSVVVFDIAGRQVGRYDVNNKQAKIDSYSLASGVYTYAVLDENEQIINRGKFSVAK
jgi:Secretion system C-terminal sorting domain